MPRKAHQSFPVFHPSHVAGVRRAATQAALELGFSSEESAKAALIATELATNLLKHTEGGEVLLRSLSPSEDRKEGDGEPMGLELIAMDKGRGISDVDQALKDRGAFARDASHGSGGNQAPEP